MYCVFVYAVHNMIYRQIGIHEWLFPKILQFNIMDKSKRMCNIIILVRYFKYYETVIIYNNKINIDS